MSKRSDRLIIGVNSPRYAHLSPMQFRIHFCQKVFVSSKGQLSEEPE
ncbi:MAG: hypothetical protein HGA26_06990 [Chlorobiaceae bacterium]|nr:hypothetical protein [Chlorobiaceae bacterium]